MKSQGRFLFYLLAGYVILQFVWWAFTLITLNDELREFWRLNDALGGNSGLSEAYFDKRFHMIIGEGAVFLGILIAGMIFVLRYMRREALIAKAERNFVLAVSHELKTPLASVRLMLQTLLKKDLPEEQRKKLIRTAIGDNKRLSSIADNVLFVARLEQGSSELTKEDVDFGKLVADICSSFQDTVARNHHLICVNEEPVFVHGDRAMLESVAINLIDNAVKYSPKGSEVRAQVVLKDQVEFSVSDEGPGIAQKEKALVFKRFYRSGEEAIRKSKGTGLGLFIVRQIVKFHQGKIVIDDNQPQGSIFRVVLPPSQENHGE